MIPSTKKKEIAKTSHLKINTQERNKIEEGMEIKKANEKFRTTSKGQTFVGCHGTHL
jgi:hypothetical protein